MPLPRRPSGFQRLRSSTMTHGAMAFSFPVTSVLYGPGACLGWVSVNPPHPRVLPSSRGLLGARSVPVSILGIHLRSKPRRKALYPSRPFIRAPVFSDHTLGAGAVLGTGESGEEDKQEASGGPEATGRTQAQRQQSSGAQGCRLQHGLQWEVSEGRGRRGGAAQVRQCPCSEVARHLAASRCQIVKRLLEAQTTPLKRPLRAQKH